MSWKDKFHPESGGAEQVTDVLLSGFVARGHVVTLISSRFTGSREKEITSNGYTIHRIGGRYSIYYKAWLLYFKKYKNSDFIIEEINAVPFFAPFILYRKKTLVFIHHVTRKIWFYQMIFPLNLVLFLIEPLYYFLLSFLNIPIFTVSESTKKDLISYGIKKERIYINQIPNELVPLDSYSDRNENEISILSLGSVRPMKRTLDIIKAFEYAYNVIPSLKLNILGSTAGKYGLKVLKYIQTSHAKNNITIIGLVNDNQKKEFMRSASMLALSSVREGWCIVATEAHSQGLPTIVYNVNGLRDSTKDGITGLVVKPTPKELGKAMIKLASNREYREGLGKQALEESRTYAPENAVTIFMTNVSNAFLSNKI